MKIYNMKNNLKKTNEWLDRKIKNKEEEHLQLEKLAILRKESGGSYSHELKLLLMSTILAVIY